MILWVENSFRSVYIYDTQTFFNFADDMDDHERSNIEVEDEELHLEDKCNVVIEECDSEIVPNDDVVENVDTEVLPLTREEKFRLLNVKCKRLIRYLSTGTHVPGLTQNQKRIVRAQARSHIWDKSSKFYCGMTIPT